MPTQPGEVTELLQALIRNACVNDGSPSSGEETRSAGTLAAYLEGVDVQRFEPTAGRTSLVARILGSDPAAPSLLYMGHTDVVPANAEAWSRDPFGGELVHGEVWGRGAVDMLNITSSMAVAFLRLASSGFRPAARSPIWRSPTRRRSGRTVPAGSSSTLATKSQPTT